MKWNIVTDSSCDRFAEGNVDEELRISDVPFRISFGDRDFTDHEKLNVPEMLDVMEQMSMIGRTSCPSPDAWAAEFEQADQVIALTISSQLSGSMNSALTAKQMVLEEHPEKKIAVIDSRSTGPELVLGVEAVRKKIKDGADFESVASYAEQFFERTRIAFALSSFDNLVKNGRMNRFTGFIARKLRMWGIGIGSGEGTIVIKGKTRGAAKAADMIIEDMRERGFRGGYAAISHCMNPELAEKLKNRIVDIWENAKVNVLPTRGLCSFYAERNGLIISFECEA